jgi:uncharacterized repeat protein (TIGR03943 family)
MSGKHGQAIKAGILVAWASFFSWLLTSGAVYRYIGPRTRWVVWFGAFLLAVTAIGQLSALKHRASDARGMSVSQVIGFAVLLVPLMILIVVPRPNLGSLAVSRKDTGALGTARSLVPPAPQDGQPVSFAEISYASTSDEYAASIGIADGYPVELTGFVSDGLGTSQDAFSLTRFQMFCCAADVIPYSVTVDPAATAPTYEQDTWLNVKGVLVDMDGEWVIRATALKEVDEPEDPYI